MGNGHFQIKKLSNRREGLWNGLKKERGKILHVERNDCRKKSGFTS